MNFLYVTALINFEVTSILNEPLRIRDDLYVTNNPAHIADFLNTSQIITVGHLEATPLTNNSIKLFSRRRFDSNEDAHLELITFLREVQGFLTAAWLIQDNAANCELGFAMRKDGHVHSNALALHYLNHAGERGVMSVTQEILEDICMKHSAFFKAMRAQDQPQHTSFRKTVPRIDRALKFLQQARSSDDVGQKIANYCSFFESLLSTSASELAHQLGERVAFVLAQDPSERFKFFREIKKAYGVRSKVVHGDILSDSIIQTLGEISKNCDDIARALLLKIINNAEFSRILNTSINVELDQYMHELIFGLSPSFPSLEN